MRDASGIEVEVLDLSVVAKWGEESLRKKGDQSTLDTNGTLGVVRTPKGDFILNDEGIVARKALAEANPWPTDLYRCTKDADGKLKSFEIIPVGVINITPAALKEIPVKEKLPLEKFIRTFGSRLETNYHICLQHLRKAMKVK